MASAQRNFNELNYEEQVNLIGEWYRNIFEEDEDPVPDRPDVVDDAEDDHIAESEDPTLEESDVEDCRENDSVRLEYDVDAENQNDEQEGDDEEAVEAAREGILYGRDGTQWSNVNIHAVGTSGGGVPRRIGKTAAATKTLSAKDTFRLLMTEEIADIIVRCTNRKAQEVRSLNQAHPDQKYTWKEFSIEEFYAFLGILLTAGVHHGNMESVGELWSDNSSPLYNATMGYKRFRAILRFLRFDNRNTRAQRLATDKAAAISEIFCMFNAKLRQFYTPGQDITIDEQLFPFRGRTRFTQYMPSKPAKYGIKVWWACDANNYYPLQGQIYTGKTGGTREVGVGERVVRDLASPYQGSGRTITCDNFFTTLPLAKFLRSWNLHLVGTLRKNKSYIPPEMLPSSRREVHSTVFGFHEGITMCSYVPKTKKAVILLSTVHRDPIINEERTDKKPQIIEFYNSTKSGVDVFDKMLRTYSVKRKTRRWPLPFFFEIVDVAALAAYIIYTMNNPLQLRKKDARKPFLLDSGKQLMMPSIIMRSTSPTVYRHIATRAALELVLKKAMEFPTQPRQRDATGRLPIVGSCFLCASSSDEKRNRKTRRICETCTMYIL